MRPYLDILRRCAEQGVLRDNRTGEPAYSVFGETFRHDLAEGFPLLTTKRLPFRWIAAELCWFLSGAEDIQYLRDLGVTIWDAWANPDGAVGPVYGKQWRRWLDPHTGQEIDQLQRVLDLLRGNPDDRRGVVSAWNPADLDRMALPPCHYAFGFDAVRGRLNCHVTMRSCDVFIGLPFNIAGYGLLTHLCAHILGLHPGVLFFAITNAHLYRNHLDQARVQMGRTPRALPRVRVDSGVAVLADTTPERFVLSGYRPHGVLHAPVAV